MLSFFSKIQPGLFLFRLILNSLILTSFNRKFDQCSQECSPLILSYIPIYIKGLIYTVSKLR